MRLKITVEQIVDLYLHDDKIKSTDIVKIAKKQLKDYPPHICIGGFETRLESRGTVKIISIKKGKQNVKI